ncbi:hypothetical protein PHJA_001227400 [Phtheirospermum japonicum]|uniref:Uncharacterized protein n=1 Tax=Phtheirospermum japonicum TaxID=374723 RepID=A0A830C672_9LAMI|nr:hypothetical protein PHJA_001227400 [Phtheirospermum japonicum]
MASNNLHKLLLTLTIFLSTVVESPAQTTPQFCPYPCYPPPTGPGNNPPVTPTPPVSTTPPATFQPPLSTTPPAGYVPFTPPSPYSFGAAPPPPEPIVTWFPYYYRKPPHKEELSSSPPLNVFTFTFVLCLLFCVQLI